MIVDKMIHEIQEQLAERKVTLKLTDKARRWLADKMPQIRMLKEQICSGDESVVRDFEVLAGPVPLAE